MTTTHPAIREFTQQLAVNARVDLLTALVYAGDSRRITYGQAAEVAGACGMTVTEDEIEDLTALDYDAQRPDVALDRLEFDHGPQGGDRPQLLEGIRATARQDYDEWVTRIATEAVPVDPAVAVLAVVNILGGDR